MKSCCFIKKLLTLSQFLTILFPDKLCITEKGTYEIKDATLEILIF